MFNKFLAWICKHKRFFIRVLAYVFFFWIADSASALSDVPVSIWMDQQDFYVMTSFMFICLIVAYLLEDLSRLFSWILNKLFSSRIRG